MLKNYVKTNIKFNKGLDGMEEKVYGFVTKCNGSWRGCYEDAEKKKLVLVDPRVAPTITPRFLYECVLVPMKSDTGFIAISASLIKFKPIIKTTYKGGKFSVTVSFGNRKMVYDPSSKEENKKDISKIADRIRMRMDVENPQQLAEDFIDAACMVKRLYEQENVH